MKDAIGKKERETQNRVVELFRDQLGYRYLGDWHHRPNNSHIEDALLIEWLAKRGYSAAAISRAVYLLHAEADNVPQGLYSANKAVYSKLRYGIETKNDPGKPTEHVHLIDWRNPENNDFAIAEEVTL